MKIWITGGAGSGKSSLAQELASAMSAGGPHYYVATMVPRDDEDRRRISRHIEDRAGMGFRTIECPCRFAERIKPDLDGTYLLDSVTAMLANAMFGEREFDYDPDAIQKVAADLRLFSERVKHFVVVSDSIFSDAAIYDEMTDGYRRGLAYIERQMAAQCGDTQMELIIGGACQGKKEYAISHFGLKDSEIFTCTEDEDLNLTARCIDHLERYLRRCTAEDREPAAPEAFRKDAVLICEDITCGIVPINALDRKWRELTGRYLQRLTGAGADVTRVFCGFAQKLGKIDKCELPEKEELSKAGIEEPKADPSRTRQILLLRHGRTRANEEHLYCGSTDLPLSEEGRKCLMQKRGVYGTEWESFYTSGLIRTKETMELLFGEQKTAKAEPDLKEMDFGDFEGKSYEMLKDDQAYREWISGDNERNICPGGESGEQMRKRVLCALDRILQNDPAKRIVIVTHGGPIAAIMQQFFPEKNLNRYEWQPECGEGYLLRITGSSLAECDAEYEKRTARGENQK